MSVVDVFGGTDATTSNFLFMPFACLLHDIIILNQSVDVFAVQCLEMFSDMLGVPIAIRSGNRSEEV